VFYVVWTVGRWPWKSESA